MEPNTSDGSLEVGQIGAADLTEPWYKVVDFLQQNWAFVVPVAEKRVEILFVSDDSGLFDRIEYSDIASAPRDLMVNGFTRFGTGEEIEARLTPPELPFNKVSHPNGPIYSSGRFWKRVAGKNLGQAPPRQTLDKDL